MRSRGLFIMAGAAVALLLASAGVVLAQVKGVSGTKHDVASPGASPCVYCHLPRSDEDELLWARHPNSTGQFSGLEPLCFSCHDGTVTSIGSYVFDASRPSHPRDPGLRGQDCDRCHDPHETDYEKFLKLPGGANFCQECHSHSEPPDHPVDVDALAAGITPQDSNRDPNAGDFSGTRLWNLEGTGPGSYVKCLSCHTPHGGEPGTELNTMPFVPSDSSSVSLCLNCHYSRSNQ